MAKMVEITCACGCGQKRKVRLSDVKRGWGKYLNKSHKARHQERQTGQYRQYLRQHQNIENVHPLSEEAFMGWM